MDSRTPVLVGAAVSSRHEEDPDRALEPIDLMIEATRAAASDARAPALCGLIDSIYTPRGFWGYADPGRLIAEHFDADSVRTCISDVGVLQTELFGGAATEIAEGRADVVLVVGAEAKHRAAQLARAGREEGLRRQPGDRAPDRTVSPHGDIVSAAEIRAMLGSPVAQYAMIENALRAAEGQTVDAHRRAIADLWAEMSNIAASNPDAWSRERVSADAIRVSSPSNRMLAFPYNKHHVSQWNVDQGAALIFTSLAKARALGIADDRLVYPRGVADANEIVFLTERGALERSPGFACAAETALSGADKDIEDIDYVELYSYFPVAVRVQQRELGLDPRKAVSVTGGMTFGGGPFNNFALQGLAKLVECLRADPGSSGLLTAVSGLLTKQGASVWSTEPGPAFRWTDVSERAGAGSGRVRIAESFSGAARIISYTLLPETAETTRLVALCADARGRRTLASSNEAQWTERGIDREEELCGIDVQLDGEGNLR